MWNYLRATGSFKIISEFQEYHGEERWGDRRNVMAPSPALRRVCTAARLWVWLTDWVAFRVCWCCMPHKMMREVSEVRLDRVAFPVTWHYQNGMIALYVQRSGGMVWETIPLIGETPKGPITLHPCGNGCIVYSQTFEFLTPDVVTLYSFKRERNPGGSHGTCLLSLSVEASFDWIHIDNERSIKLVKGCVIINIEGTRKTVLQCYNLYNWQP